MGWVSKFGWGAMLLSIASLLPAQSVVINEYPIPPGVGLGSPWGIAAGPDGALWFTTSTNIGRITTAGTITGLPAGGGSGGITVGPDGALWFTLSFSTEIGRITTTGIATDYPIQPGFSPVEITAGSDGALWFTEFPCNIARITTAGVVSQYLPNVCSQGITTGPDGALWFGGCGWIGRFLPPFGSVTSYPLVGLPGFASCPTEITAGPDGAVWFTDYNGNGIGRITTSGISIEWAIPTPNSNPRGITSGPDGAMWFAEHNVGKIGRITTSGTITEFPTPTANSYPMGITTGPDGAVWFTEQSGAIGQVVLGQSGTGKPVSHVSALPASEQVANFAVQWSGSDTGFTITSFTIYVSDNGGPFTAWLTTPGTQATYPGVVGHNYGFYSIAHDQAGLSENPKSAAEATTYVAAAPGDLNADGAVNCADINVVMASFGARVGQPRYNPVADINHDGVVNVKDLSWVSQYLVPGTQCPH